jgi:hypothetical protein
VRRLNWPSPLPPLPNAVAYVHVSVTGVSFVSFLQEENRSAIKMNAGNIFMSFISFSFKMNDRLKLKRNSIPFYTIRN